MSKSSRQATILVALAAVLLALQATAVWTAIHHVDEILAFTGVGVLSRASQQVARAVTHDATARSETPVVTQRTFRTIHGRTIAVATLESPALEALSLDALELPEAKPIEPSCSGEITPIEMPEVSYDVCVESACPTTSSTARMVAVAKPRAASSMSQEGCAEDDAPSRDERGRDRDRDRDRDRGERHDAIIGPLQPAAMGSVW